MPAKTMSSLRDESRDLQKQIGCVNGIFQLFDRHHFLAGRRSGGGDRRLIQDVQRQQDFKHPKSVVTEKGQEKPRTSTESSRASYSSSTCSTSTYSSLDCNRISQLDPIQLRPISIPESTFHISATKKQQQLVSAKIVNLQGIVKDSVYREVRLSASNERRGNAMKHIDSPRPLQLNSDAKKRQCKDDRLALPRFSYDGRDSRETAKLDARHREHPRLSLDSKTSSIKYSALESRSNFLVREQNVGNENPREVLPSDQEPGSHHRSSSIIAKLMGLEAFPGTMALSESQTPTSKPCPKEDFRSQLASAADKSKPNQAIYSPRLQNHSTEASPRLSDTNSVWKPNSCSRLPGESAPWRQQDCGQGSPHNRKAAMSAPRLPLSVYGEIEKRIAELEFKKSGKDLRALKQILEAMEKMRERVENQRGESAEARTQRCEDSYSNQSSNLSMLDDRKSYHRVPANGSSRRRQSGSPVVIMKPAKMMDKVTAEMSPLHRLQTQGSKYHQEKSVGRQKDKDFSPKSNLRDRSQKLPSPSKKTTWRTSEMDRSPARPQHIKVENCNSLGKGSGTTSPRVQQNPLRIGLLSHSIAPLSDTREIKKYSSKRVTEGSPNRKHKVKAKDFHISDDQLSELSSETRHSSYHADTASVKSESNNSLVSQTETEIRHKENSMSRMRKHVRAVESVVTMVEQPSPISVLDDAFYCEGSPSPVKKTSTAFRDETTDDIPGSGEEWHLENPKHLTEYRRSDHRCKHNQKLERLKHPIQELSFLPNETAENHNALVYDGDNQDHRYINKILLISGLLKDPNFISATDQLLPSYHLINPDMFHVIEQTEEVMVNGEVTDKNDNMKPYKKIQRKIIFDMVDEILVRKINSGRFAVGKKMASPQALLKEIYFEMDQVCQISNCNLDNREDEITKLLTADLKHQSEDWANYSGEVPALVLDIERQVFKDLINEVVTGEVMELRNQPKSYRRQLFRH